MSLFLIAERTIDSVLKVYRTAMSTQCRSHTRTLRSRMNRIGGSPHVPHTCPSVTVNPSDIEGSRSPDRWRQGTAEGKPSNGWSRMDAAVRWRPPNRSRPGSWNRSRTMRGQNTGTRSRSQLHRESRDVSTSCWGVPHRETIPIASSRLVPSLSARLSIIVSVIGVLMNAGEAALTSRPSHVSVCDNPDERCSPP